MVELDETSPLLSGLNADSFYENYLLISPPFTLQNRYI